MPQVSDADMSRAQNYHWQKERADHLAAVLAAVIKHHGPLTFNSLELRALIGTDPQLVTTYDSTCDTYTLQVK